jgi:hypothetical protein
LEEATLTVVKDAIPDDGQDFSYTSTGFDPATFSLEDDGDEGTNPSSQTFTFSGSDFDPGDETVTEDGETGWTLTDLDCIGDDDFSEAGATATLNVEPGEEIVCTYENQEDEVPETPPATPPGDEPPPGGGVAPEGGGGTAEQPGGGEGGSPPPHGGDEQSGATAGDPGGTLPLTGLGLLALVATGVGLLKTGFGTRLFAKRRQAP